VRSGAGGGAACGQGGARHAQINDDEKTEQKDEITETTAMPAVVKEPEVEMDTQTVVAEILPTKVLEESTAPS